MRRDLDPETTAICGIPVGQPGYIPYKNSVQVRCDGLCHMLLWIGPVSNAMHEANPAVPILCPICMVIRCDGASVEVKTMTTKKMGD